MEKIEQFTAPRTTLAAKFRKADLAGELIGIWKLVQGEDYLGTDESARRSAYMWAARQREKGRQLKVITAVAADRPGVVEIEFLGGQ